MSDAGGSQQIKFSQAASYEITRTSPTRIVRHDISDDELDKLCEAQQSDASTWKGVFAGGLVGSLPTAISGSSSYLATSKLTLTELSSLLTAVVSFFLLVTLLILTKGVKKRSNSVRNEIRSRQSAPA